MDHSIEGYLKRQPTQKLREFLKKCYEGEASEDFSNVIPLVEEEIKRRKHDKNQIKPSLF